MKRLLSIISIAVLALGAANAQILSINFDDPDQPGAAGDTLQFFGTITNNSDSTVFLNNDALNFTLSDASYMLTDDFFNTPVSLDPDSTSTDIELFDITLSDPQADPLDTYPGTYGLIGGADGNAQDNLGQANFSVTTTPEPSSWVFLLTGLGLMSWRVRRN